MSKGNQPPLLTPHHILNFQQRKQTVALNYTTLQQLSCMSNIECFSKLLQKMTIIEPAVFAAVIQVLQFQPHSSGQKGPSQADRKQVDEFLHDFPTQTDKNRSHSTI